MNAAGTWSLGNALDLMPGPAQPLTSAISAILVNSVLDGFIAPSSARNLFGAAKL